MELQEFKSQALSLFICWLQAIDEIIRNKKIDDQLKHTLIATAVSVTIYILDEFQNRLDDSISQ